MFFEDEVRYLRSSELLAMGYIQEQIGLGCFRGALDPFHYEILGILNYAIRDAIKIPAF